LHFDKELSAINLILGLKNAAYFMHLSISLNIKKSRKMGHVFTIAL
jgi:hypothetical protein